MKFSIITFVLLGIVALSQGCTSGTPPKSFNSPDDAVNALIAAARSHSTDQLKDVLGSSSSDVISSGDAVADANALDNFLARYDEKHLLQPEADGSQTLIVGNNDWPMPIPVVKNDKTNMWSFDTDRGKDEIINRRIGRNELDTIQVCLAIADAQREYAARDPQAVGVPVYAQKILSDPGTKNGLFWKAQEGEDDSPLGELAAGAAAEGYRRPTDGAPSPYHGYFYRVLLKQGPHAQDGARSYVVDGKMVSGFAVLAYPADYGNSGIMTFIINHDGVVYQRDLGDATDQTAKSIAEFDPDPTWQKVDAAATKPAPAGE